MNRILETITAAVCSLPPKERIIIAVDGRSASGKTTLAGLLEKALDASVFHMDDFFLRPGQRTAERLDTPGGNVDHERFFDEILRPLISGDERICYRPYDCGSQTLRQEICAVPKKYVIIEGAYACHPSLRDHYDLRIFLTVPPEEQMRRIIRRSGVEKAAVFRDRWIPLEERYFAECRVREYCGLSFDNSSTKIIG